MNENSLRWQGRIGGLRGVSMFALLFLAMIAFVAGMMMISAFKNPGGPQSVTINQLVNGEIAKGKYVTFSGLAAYDIGYEEMDESGAVTTTYYFMIERNSGDMVLIKHSSPTVIAKANGMATVTGLTRFMSLDLQNLVKADLPLIQNEGLNTSTSLIVVDGDAPPKAGPSTTVFLLCVIGGLICVVPFLFPSTIFATYPLDATSPRPEGRPPIKASGKFTELKSIKPLKIGVKKQKFNEATANIIARAERDLVIYIHHVMTTKTYGITVRKTESDWAAFVNGDNVVSVEAGKILGWKDKWTVRFQVTGVKVEPEVLDLIFEGPGDQALVAELLQKMKFDVVAGEAN